MDDGSLEVMWEPPSVAEGVESYEAWVEKQVETMQQVEAVTSCKVDRNTDRCKFDGLESFANYKVHLRSCDVAPDFAGREESKLCSVEVTGVARTLHSGKK